MACLYKRKRSPYFWLKFRESGQTKYVSTECRIDRGPDVRRARQMQAEKTLEELKPGNDKADGRWKWVDSFIKIRYQDKPSTFERYSSAWATIQLFLEEREILGPIHLTRKHCFDYVEWRQQPDKRKGKYEACHNTALLELKILRLILQEAVERELCAGNPCVKLGLKKHDRKLKPELTQADSDLIRSKFPLVTDLVVREMLQNSFEIAWYQGCRLTETRVHPERDVDLNAMTIRFKAKGNKDFVTALHPKLVPLFTQLRADGRASTWAAPEKAARQWASSKWFKFLDRHGLKEKIGKDACFHSTRVTVVTRLARAGVSISKSKGYVGHASTTIHEMYQRLKPTDLESCTDVLT